MKKRNWIKICLGIAGIALIVVLVFTLIPKTGPWLSGYTYRQKIDLSRASGAVTNYQMKLTVDKTTGSSSSSTVYLQNHAESWTGTIPNDVRFTESDGVTQLDYWIETSDTNTATVWIECDSIGTSDTYFYIYYGKSSDTTTSDGDNTFLFFDDFSGSSLDGNKWTVIQGDVSVSDDTLILTGTTGTRGLIDGKTTIPLGAAIHTKVKSDSNNIIATDHICSLRKSADWNDRVDIYGTTLANEASFYTSDAGNGTQTSQIAISTCSAYHEYQVIWITSEAKSYQDTTLLATHTTNVPSTDLVAVFYEAGSVDDNAWIDWVFVRKFVSPEPTWGIWGSEEKNTS